METQRGGIRVPVFLLNAYYVPNSIRAFHALLGLILMII